MKECTRELIKERSLEALAALGAFSVSAGSFYGLGSTIKSLITEKDNFVCKAVDYLRESNVPLPIIMGSFVLGYFSTIALAVGSTWFGLYKLKGALTGNDGPFTSGG